MWLWALVSVKRKIYGTRTRDLESHTHTYSHCFFFPPFLPALHHVCSGTHNPRHQHSFIFYFFDTYINTRAQPRGGQKLFFLGRQGLKSALGDWANNHKLSLSRKTLRTCMSRFSARRLFAPFFFFLLHVWWGHLSWHPLRGQIWSEGKKGWWREENHGCLIFTLKITQLTHPAPDSKALGSLPACVCLC